MVQLNVFQTVWKILLSILFAGSGDDEEVLFDVIDNDDNNEDLIRLMEHDSDVEIESGSDDSTSSQGIDR